MFWATQCTNPHYGRSIDQGRRKLFSIGGGGLKARAAGPRKFYKFRVSEMPFPGLWGRYDRILMVRKQLVCRNLQFSSTKWAKAYLINYILDKLQESMGNIFILYSLSWIK
jgi:hypothetical protein